MMKLISYVFLLLIIIQAESLAQGFKLRKAYQAGYPSMMESEEKGALTFDDLKLIKSITDSAYKLYSTLPANEIDSSSFRYLQLSDSFSILGDTLNAGRFFKQIDPFHVKSILDLTGLSIDTMLGRFKIPEKVKNEYYQLYHATTSSFSSPIYDTFMQFHFDAKRRVVELDSVSQKYKHSYERLLTKEDSLQFAYLRKYIKQHGWPTIRKGSVLAANIAGRDIEHYYFYLPYLKEAFYKGEISLSLLSKTANNDPYFYGYIRVKKSKGLPHKCYDVSAFKDDFANKFLASQSLSGEILIDLKNNCEVRDFFFVYYAKNPQLSGKKWVFHDDNRRECTDLLKRVDEVCPNHDSHKNGNGRHLYLPNYIYLKDKEFFCTVYDE